MARWSCFIQIMHEWFHYASLSYVEQAYKYDEYTFTSITFSFSTKIKQILIQHASSSQSSISWLSIAWCCWSGRLWTLSSSSIRQFWLWKSVQPRWIWRLWRTLWIWSIHGWWLWFLLLIRRDKVNFHSFFIIFNSVLYILINFNNSG